MTIHRLRCRNLVTPDEVLEDPMLVINQTTIEAIEPWERGQPTNGIINGWVLPGFVDTHTHGAGGHDVASGNPDDVREVAAFARRHGSTSIFASLVTASLDALEDQLRTLAPLAAAGQIAGIHLEGPFLSEAKRGAHNPNLLRDPDAGSVDRLLAAADGRLSMITIAPELPGALETIRRFVGAGVTVAIGHTDGDDHAARAALDSGARVATHLFNAMPPIHHRTPGPVPLLLTDPRATVELICDGVHLHPEVAKMAIAAAGPRRVALITDAMVATGMPDGDYRLGSLDVRVADGVARLQDADGGAGSIAGSTLTMDKAVAYCVQELGLPIAEVATMAATTPAGTHGLDHVGSLQPGKRADLAVVDDQGNLLSVMSAGQWQEDVR